MPILDFLFFINSETEHNAAQNDSWFIMILWPLAVLSIFGLIHIWEEWVDKKKIKLRLAEGLELQELSISELQNFINTDMSFLAGKKKQKFESLLVDSVNEQAKKDELINEILMEIKNMNVGCLAFVFFPLLIYCIYQFMQFYYGLF